MPEILTKYPNVVIKVLESQGAKCGSGAKPKILTKCPADQFCTLEGGELCVYGANELPEMTQLAPAEVCQARSSSIERDSETFAAVGPSDDRGSQTIHAETIAVPIGILVLWCGLVLTLRTRRLPRP